MWHWSLAEQVDGEGVGEDGEGRWLGKMGCFLAEQVDEE